MTEESNWIAEDDLRFRAYRDYAEYVRHQAEKLGRISLDGYSQQFREALRKRLADLPFLHRGTTVLCLGARNGVECQCFIELGCVAIGVDLNPGDKNKFVVTGDFHDLQFATDSFDVVFTNSLDHAFELDKVLSECRRVLKPDGHFVAEVVRGSKDPCGREPGEYESCWWNQSESLIRRIRDAGLKEVRRSDFRLPWIGDRFVFVRGT